MSKKEDLYFELDGEYCYPLQYFQEQIEDGEEKIILQLAHRVMGEGLGWCKEFGEPIEDSSDVCGRGNCDKYKPRNGKNGCCIHRTFCYEPSGQELILTKEGIK